MPFYLKKSAPTFCYELWGTQGWSSGVFGKEAMVLMQMWHLETTDSAPVEGVSGSLLALGNALVALMDTSEVGVSYSQWNNDAVSFSKIPSLVYN